MVNWLKLMVLSCFMACTLIGQGVMLLPQEILLAGETTTLWGVLAGSRWHDETLSRQWEEQEDDLPILEEGEVCSYVWEYDCGAGVTMDDCWPCGLVRPLADSWHLFDTQCFKLEDGRMEGEVVVRLRYWDDNGKEWMATRQMKVIAQPQWSDRTGVDIRRKMAVIRGLHYLQRRQREDGFWWDGGDECYRASTTGCALWAFGNHGYGIGNQKDNPFLSCVEAGIRRLVWLGDVWPLNGQMGRLDGNRNGRAVRLGEGGENSNYVHPICLCGMMAVGRPDYEVELSGEIGQFGGMPPGSPIPCTLGELVGDGIEYILMQLSASDRNSWAYNYMDRTDGYDLSIAGWNYLALLAGEGWGIDVDEAAKLKIQSFMETVYHDDLQFFTYTPSRQSFHTESLDASGLMGLLLMSGRGLGEDGLQRFAGSGNGIGSALLDGTNQLFEWVRQSSGRSVGYSWWSVAKGLGLTGVNSKWIDGRLFDWRYGWSDGTDGGWRKILECQEADGRWTIEDEAHASGLTRVDPRQTCMETAMMTLALSDNVLPELKVEASPVVVQLQLPHTVIDGMENLVSGPEMVLDDDGVLLSWMHAPMASGDVWDLSFDYWLPTAEEEGTETVQIGGTVVWEVAGNERSIQLEELSVERGGRNYELEVECEETVTWGEEMMIGVWMSLPLGDMSHVVQLVESETILWDSPGMTTWLAADLGGLRRGDVEFACLPDRRMRSWVGMDVAEADGRLLKFKEGVCGQRLKASLADVSEGGTIVVYGNEDVIYASVSMEQAESGKTWTVEEWEVAASSFGGMEAIELPFDCVDFQPGIYRCHAKIWKEGTILAEASCPLEIVLPEGRDDWLAERRSEPIVELELEDKTEIEPEEPLNPDNPEDPEDPEEPPKEPDKLERHGVHFLKRTVENGGKADSDENALKNVVVQAERPLRQEEENSQPQNRAEIMSQPERTIPGAWANTVNANGLGLRWGRIVTKRGPYPWELERSIIVVPVKRPLCYRSIPVICKHCKQLHCLVGWWYESEKECCIYHMVNHRNWRLK